MEFFGGLLSMKVDRFIYVWHCPKCANKGQNLFKPFHTLCILCDEELVFETMIPLYIFD